MNEPNHAIKYTINQTVEKSQALALKIVASMKADKKPNRIGKDIQYNLHPEGYLTLTVKKISNKLSCLALEVYPQKIKKPSNSVVVVIGEGAIAESPEDYKLQKDNLIASYQKVKEEIEKGLESIEYTKTEKHLT